MNTSYVRNLMDRNFLINELVHNTETLVSFIKEQDCVLNHPVGSLPEERKWRDFVECEWWESEASVNLFEIEGTDCPAYKDLSWVDLLITESRERRKEIAEEVDQCLFSGRCLSASAVELDGKIYVESRACTHIAIAKVMGYFLGRKRVTLRQHRRFFVKYDIKILVKLIESLLLSVSSSARMVVKSKPLRRIDVPGWMREETTFSFVVENSRKAQRLHLREDELIPFLQEIINFKKSPIRRLFRNRYTRIL